MDERIRLSLKRFVKFGILSFCGAGVVAISGLQSSIPTTWEEFHTFAIALVWALLVGGLSGLLGAVEKFVRFYPELKTGELPSTPNTQN